MAIYGAGSIWSDEEMKDTFFADQKFILGWNEASAKDLYEVVAQLKVGDILYLKSSRPGSRNIRVKGIGFVTKSVIQCITDNEYGDGKISDWESLFVKINWQHKTEFTIEIPESEGKLTNIRAATIYEEYLPFVQKEILAKILN